MLALALDVGGCDDPLAHDAELAGARTEPGNEALFRWQVAAIELFANGCADSIEVHGPRAVANGGPTTRSCYPRDMPPKTMRASFYEGPGRFATGTVAVPAPARGEALLRVRRVGICGTDLHIFQGHLDHRVPRGGVIGHETFAEVVEAPKDSGFAAGDRVVVEPLWFCGACRACRMGGSYLCYKLKVLGVDLPGGMREYWSVPVARLLRVPAALGDDHAALIEPLSVATHDVRRAQVGTGDAVVVFGGGPIGALIAMVARQPGSRLYAREDWEEAIRLAASGAITLGPLVSRTIPLEALQDGMEQALGGGPFMKVLVDLTA